MSEVFARYGRRQITVDEVAEFIGAKPKQVDESDSGFGGAGRHDLCGGHQQL